MAADLKRIAERNPWARTFVEKRLAAIIDGALVVLANACDDFTI